MNAAARATDMIELLGDLVEIMRRENEILKLPRDRSLDPVVKRKVALVSVYERHLREVAARPGFKDELEPPLLNKLRAAGEEFNKALEENERRLQAAMATTQKVVDAVAAAAQKLSGVPSGYSKAGVETGQTGQHIPLAVDRQI